jgi:L-fuconolactonase
VAYRIVDSHVHFWDPVARHHEWLAEVPQLNRRLGPEDYDPGRHELHGFVFVQADCRDEEALAEARWVAELAGSFPLIRGIVAYAPLQRGRAVESHLDALADVPLVVGVRRLLQDRPLEEITDAAFIDGVRLLAARNLRFDICIRHAQLPAATELVEACPDTLFVLDHLGKPPVAEGALDPWREHMTRLAAHPNVACKLSGLSTEAAPGWQDADVVPYLEHALEVFGPNRCMAGSDWPVATLATTVERWFDVIVDVTVQLAEVDQAAVLGATAETIYDLADEG